MANENNGSYYDVDSDLYEELKLDAGAKVIVYWDGKKQDDSDPPSREAGDIEVVSEKD